MCDMCVALNGTPKEEDCFKCDLYLSFDYDNNNDIPFDFESEENSDTE